MRMNGEEKERVVPQHVATTIVDSLRDKTHQPNAASSIYQVDVPFNLSVLYFKNYKIYY